MSLKLHPDKSDDPDAEAKFRQLVSVADVLKDEAKRQKYDQVLINGLPDWRSGMYYIRRARKLGLMEMSILVSLITTIGHYLCVMAAYYEKVYEVKEMIRRKEKKLKQKEYEQLFEEVMQVNGVIRPSIGRDNLPVRLARSSYRLLFTHIPVAAAHSIQLLKEYFERKEDELEAENEPILPKVKKIRTKPELPDLTGEKSEDEDESESGHQTGDEPQPASSFKSDEWSQDEILLLIKMTKKFPGGTTGRWERIATAMGRSVDDVTKMSKNIRGGQVRVAEPFVTAKSAAAVNVSCSDISSRDAPAVEPPDSVLNWTQAEQKLLEEGLQKFPRGLDDRWDRIADFTGRKKVNTCESSVYCSLLSDSSRSSGGESGLCENWCTCRGTCTNFSRERDANDVCL